MDPTRDLRRCAFLTLADPSDYVIDDPLAVAPLRELGWQVEEVVWDRPGVDWRAFDLVLIRTPWDYHRVPDRFLAVLEDIVATGAWLENDLALVRWNLDKSYLRDLEARGVPIVPTSWHDGLEPGGLARLLEGLPAGDVILKPVVGANADDAFWLQRAVSGTGSSLLPPAEQVRAIESCFREQPFLAQPFVRSVVEEGEHSLFYFNGAYSHCILKTPKPRDFRVQEEHGGRIQPAVAGDDLHAAGERVMQALAATPLQARADFVRAPADQGLWLMELELIEPSLYLRMDPAAPRRFAAALDRRHRDRE